MSSDRSSGLPPTPGPTDAWAEEFAKELADQLEGWCFEREKVLAKLDLRAAKVGRALVRSLRTLARSLHESAAFPQDPARLEIMKRLVQLRHEARKLMTDGVEAVEAAGYREVDPADEPRSQQRDWFAGNDVVRNTRQGLGPALARPSSQSPTETGIPAIRIKNEK
jgi:hypothetical protein